VRIGPHEAEYRARREEQGPGLHRSGTDNWEHAHYTVGSVRCSRRDVTGLLLVCARRSVIVFAVVHVLLVKRVGR